MILRLRHYKRSINGRENPYLPEHNLYRNKKQIHPVEVIAFKKKFNQKVLSFFFIKPIVHTFLIKYVFVI